MIHKYGLIWLTMRNRGDLIHDKATLYMRDASYIYAAQRLISRG
jgi:hypothetical protein